MSMILRSNYEDYDKVLAAFKNLIHAVVWESTNLEEGVEEDKINANIEKYCKLNANDKIQGLNQSFQEFLRSMESRFQATFYECDENGIANEETAIRFETDNEKFALAKAAKFYRNAKRPRVQVYDNYCGKFIADWK